MSMAHVKYEKPRIVMMPTASSLVASEFVIMTTFSATIVQKVGIMTILGFQCIDVVILHQTI